MLLQSDINVTMSIYMKNMKYAFYIMKFLEFRSKSYVLCITYPDFTNEDFQPTNLVISNRNP